jgi:hypothetical protein
MYTVEGVINLLNQQTIGSIYSKNTTNSGILIASPSSRKQILLFTNH